MSFEKRPYQDRIVKKTVDMFMGRYVKPNGETQIHSRSVMIESPTGSGKTVMALKALSELQKEVPDLEVGWVAMRRNLLHQAARENVDKGFNIRNIHFTSMFDKNPAELRLWRICITLSSRVLCLVCLRPRGGLIGLS